MELITRDVKQNIEKAQEIQQVTFDDDYVIKDNKPDVQKIICQTGMVKTDDIEQTGETIWVTGNIEFEVLYKSDDEGEKVETIKDLIPFQEKVIAVYQRIPGSNLPDSLQRGIFQTPVKLYGNYQTLADSLLCRRFRITNHQWDRTYPGHPFYLVKNQVA